MPDIVTEIFLIGMFLAAFVEKFDDWGLVANCDLNHIHQ